MGILLVLKVDFGNTKKSGLPRFSCFFFKSVIGVTPLKKCILVSSLLQETSSAMELNVLAQLTAPKFYSITLNILFRFFLSTKLSYIIYTYIFGFKNKNYNSYKKGCCKCNISFRFSPTSNWVTQNRKQSYSFTFK